jgi:hypothetical protein
MEPLVKSIEDVADYISFSLSTSFEALVYFTTFS